MLGQPRRAVDFGDRRSTRSRKGDMTMGLNVLLWIVQGLLALIFLFAGGMKLVLPLEALAGPIPLPGLFMRLLGVAEVLGAIGLILPGLLRIRPGLTPLAAAGLVIVMTGATVITVVGGDVGVALVPLIVGLLSGSVAYGRSRLVPISGRGARGMAPTTTAGVLAA
jgi:uncharacterized membrane protein YphA (DoxX/SURF4 family)